ncbi:hypothetical protein GCM10007933_21350 [Zoogloea oryzae]|uniref:Uncharacterized protein n=1 Tax=Zoogloea oryzae TaxID=310767 RepID=A0ABQ6FAR1_9RHOO|nr:hypothetical protein [Zoogloea oryzae]GLT22675.1 hypothetical protein GCM10007933_21350 [Zoogloea oryzae]
MNRLQSFVFCMVVCFGLGVLCTLWGLEAEYRDRLNAAKRAKLDCEAVQMLAQPQPNASGVES